MSVEESPEFKKAMNEACERQYRGFLFGGEYARASSKDTIADTMEEMQRQRNEVERTSMDARLHAEQVRNEITIKSNPHMREITSNLKRRSGVDVLVCPVCGEGDQGNRMDRIPICYMIDKHKGLGPVPLMTPEKARDWKPPKKKSPRGSYTFKEPDGVMKWRK